MARTRRSLERQLAAARRELRMAEERLAREVAQRAAIEAELVHAQKLESVGRLAAGVAHELNTPIQFVSDSCTFVRDAATDVLGLVQTASDLLEGVRDGRIPAAGCVDAFTQAAEQAELDYLQKRVPAALQRAGEGLERIAAIVRALKEFAHPSRDQGPADVRRGLEATLEIARNEYKYVADVVTEFGDLPPVVCHIGELNQVFLNLIVNAAHAIEELSAPRARGTIRIRTWTDGPDAKIAISDTGAGIPDSVRDRIFEPFFTTKGVGKGTGQGLAIARAVIDKHGGRIDVATAVGAGTTFTIAIPIEGNPHRVAA